MGDNVHNALKYFFNVDPDKRTKTILLNLLENQWRKRPGRAGGFWTPEIEHDYKTRAQLMLSSFFDREDMSVRPVWASDKIIRAGVSEELEFMGKIDRVDQTSEGLHIIDYKTSREEREDEWQLPMYAVMARRFFNKPIAQLSYVFLETGSWISVPANPARENYTIGRIQQIVESMPHSQDKNAWQCSDAETCTHCDYLKEFGIDPLGEVVTLTGSPAFPTPANTQQFSS